MSERAWAGVVPESSGLSLHSSTLPSRAEGEVSPTLSSDWGLAAEAVLGLKYCSMLPDLEAFSFGLPAFPREAICKV
jgi:hypothetical protein